MSWKEVILEDDGFDDMLEENQLEARILIQFREGQDDILAEKFEESGWATSAKSIRNGTRKNVPPLMQCPLCCEHVEIGTEICPWCGKQCADPPEWAKKKIVIAGKELVLVGIDSKNLDDAIYKLERALKDEPNIQEFQYGYIFFELDEKGWNIMVAGQMWHPK